jgi:hypothetical protein
MCHVDLFLCFYFIFIFGYQLYAFAQEDIAREVEHMAKSKTGFEVNFMDVWRMKVHYFLLRLFASIHTQSNVLS